MNISISNISKKFNDTTVLNNLSLSIKKGEIVAILGSSGSGKSTFLNIIAGFEQADNGQVVVGDSILYDQDEKVFILPEKRNIGYLFQNFSLFPHMNVFENVAFGIAGKKPTKVARVKEMLELVGLSGYEKRFSHQLSGGQQQRISLARALAPSPNVLLLDEPFSGLDTDLRVATREEIRNIIKKTAATVILVTHDQEEAFAIADRVAIINKGLVEQISTPEQVYHNPTSKYVASFVGKANFIKGSVVAEGIKTELGLFENKNNLTLATKVNVMIRPEYLTLTIKENALAEVQSRRFNGAENIYSIKLASGHLLDCKTSSFLKINPLTKVKITVNMANIVIFEECNTT